MSKKKCLFVSLFFSYLSTFIPNAPPQDIELGSCNFACTFPLLWINV